MVPMRRRPGHEVRGQAPHEDSPMTRTSRLAVIRSCISALARAVVVILGLAATGGGDFPRM